MVLRGTLGWDRCICSLARVLVTPLHQKIIETIFCSYRCIDMPTEIMEDFASDIIL